MSGEIVCFYCKKASNDTLCYSCRSFMAKRDDLRLQVEALGLARAAAQNGMTPNAVLAVLHRPAKGAAGSS